MPDVRQTPQPSTSKFILPTHVKFAGSNLAASVSEKRLHRVERTEYRDMPPVARHDVVKMIGYDESATPWHVSRNNGGIAGDEVAEVTRQQPRVRVEASARTETDQEVNGLVSIEVCNRIRASRRWLRRHHDGEGHCG